MNAIFVVLITLLSLSTCAVITRILIPFLKERKLGQSILAIGPAWHKPKEGTPTMGGIVFLVTIPLFSILAAFLLDPPNKKPLLFLLFFAIANGLIGTIDDATKLKNKKNQGLLPWQKLFLQSFFVAGFLYLFFRFSESDLSFFIPFTSVRLSEGIPLLLVFFVALLGILNCVNLSDGIDGLTASSAAVLGAFFLAEGILHDEEALTALGASVLGSMLGFLLFNKNPAKIFMGDTGSLFLGALLCGAAFLTDNPCVLPIFCFLFLLEGGSVILQVLHFKRTGRRLFRMAPIHHHLEKCGWSEKRIVLVFSLITLICCVFAHFALL